MAEKMVCNVMINSSLTKNNIHSILQLYEHILLKISQKKKKNLQFTPMGCSIKQVWISIGELARGLEFSEGSIVNIFLWAPVICIIYVKYWVKNMYYFIALNNKCCRFATVGLWGLKEHSAFNQNIPLNPLHCTCSELQHFPSRFIR